MLISLWSGAEHGWIARQQQWRHCSARRMRFCNTVQIEARVPAAVRGCLSGVREVPGYKLRHKRALPCLWTR